MTDKLPDYEKRPLDEIVFGIQFEPLKHFGVRNVFRYWSKISEQYPQVEEQQILLHTLEQPDLAPSKKPKLLIAPSDPVPMSRFWFLDATGNNLVQIQND